MTTVVVYTWTLLFNTSFRVNVNYTASFRWAGFVNYGKLCDLNMATRVVKGLLMIDNQLKQTIIQRNQQQRVNLLQRHCDLKQGKSLLLIHPRCDFLGWKDKTTFWSLQTKVLELQ